MLIEDNYRRIFKTWYPFLKPIVFNEKFQKMFTNLEFTYKAKYCTVLPNAKAVFSPFKLCNFDDLHTVILFDRRIYNEAANGLAFGQSDDSNSLDMEIQSFIRCLENSFDKGLYLNCDITLEPLAKQGFLLLNTCQTLEQFNVKRHKKFWYKFIMNLFKLLSKKDKINYILIGERSWEFSKYITGKNSYIFKTESFKVADSQNRDWNFDFRLIDALIKLNHKKTIIW